jgi:hypothetical protein
MNCTAFEIYNFIAFFFEYLLQCILTCTLNLLIIGISTKDSEYGLTNQSIILYVVLNFLDKPASQFADLWDSSSPFVIRHVF